VCVDALLTFDIEPLKIKVRERANGREREHVCCEGLHARFVSDVHRFSVVVTINDVNILQKNTRMKCAKLTNLHELANAVMS